MLLVEDDEDDYVVTRDLLSAGAGFALDWALGAAEGLNALAAGAYDVVLLDYRLGAGTGLDFLRALPGADVPPVILLTGHAGHGTDLAAMRLGAADYLDKDELSPAVLQRAIRYAIERHRAQVARREAERRYQLLVGSIGAIIWQGDPDTLQFTFVSREAEHLLGFPVERWTEEPDFWRNQVHPADRDWAVAECARASLQREAHTFEYRMVCADGRVVWVRDIVRSVEIDGRHELAGVMVDVTAAHETEEKLRLRDRALAAVNEGIVITDPNQPDNPIVYVNPAFERVTGYAAGEVVGRNCRLLQGEGTEPAAVAAVRQAVREARTDTVELLNYRKDGTPFWNCLSISPITDAAGRLTHFVGVQRDVTAARAAREELQASHALLSAIIDGTPDAVFAKNLEGRYLLINRAGAAFLGRTPDEVVGRADAELLPAETARVFREADARVIDGGEASTSEETGETAGEVRTYHAIKAPFRGADGRITGLVGISRDITLRRQMEEALRESHERFELVQRATHDVIWDWDIARRRVLWNEETTRMFGYVPETEGTDLEWWAAKIHPEDAEAVAGSLHAALRDARSWTAEYRYRRADGSYVVVLDRGHILRDEAGQAVRMIGSMQDVTERRRLTGALEQSEAQYRRLVDNAPQTIYAVDRDGRFTEANPAAVELLGRPLAELLGRHFADVVVAEDLPRTQAAFQALLTGAAPEVALELRIHRPSGETRLVHIQGVVIREGSEVTGGHGIARDVTEEREQEQRLRRAERLASIGTLVGGVAHELNNPLAAIVGFTQLLLMDEASQGAREDLETIQREAQRMAEIVANLRRIARDSQEPSGAREPVDLNDVVRHVVRTLTYSLRTQNVEIREDLEPELPGVLGDRGQIEQVVLNLVVNAEQAMEGRADSRLILRTRRTPGGACLHVVDNGPGIPQADLERIFDPFFTTKSPGEGTGLGLSLVHSIVTEHGGEIQVDSRVNAGTAFRVDFPRAPHSVHPEPAPEARATPGTPHRPLRILVVDDEETVRRVVVRFLNRRGHAVDEAPDGEAALALIEAQGGGEYDAILSDLRMPGLQGTQLLARLKARDPALERRLVFMTGDTARVEAERLIEEAGVPVLAKPVDLKALAAALEGIAG